MASIRFGASGSVPYNDHRQLQNIGRYEHTLIDQFIDELENARANDLSLGDRLDNIEKVNLEQDTILSNIDSIRKDLDSLGLSVEEIITIITSKSEDIESLKELALKHQLSIDELSELVNNLINQTSVELSALIKEVHDARLDTKGVLHTTLKDRLDDMQNSSNTGNPVVGGVNVIRYFIEHITLTSDTDKVIKLSKDYYVVGSNELDVFINGIRQTLGSDYIELSQTSIELLTPSYNGDIVTLRVRDRSNPLWTNTIISESIGLSHSISTYTLSTSFSSTKVFLEVYLNGKLLIEDADYVKLESNNIEVLFPTYQDDILLCQIIDTEDRGIKQLIEHVSGITGKSSYSLRTFKVNVGDKNLEVYRNGVLLSMGADYVIGNYSEITFLSTIFNEDRLTFCIENFQGKAVHMATFRELEEKVNALTSAEHKNTTFELGDWIKEGDDCYTFVLPFSQHVTQRNKIVVEVYEEVGEMYYKVGCNVGVNKVGDVILQSASPFTGNIIVL